MSAIYIHPIPGANGDINKGLKILRDSIPDTTEIYCPYIGHIFPVIGTVDRLKEPDR